MRQQPTFEGHDLTELEAVRDEALKARAARLTELQARWEAIQAEAARHGGFFDPGNEEIALQRRDTERSQWNDLYDEIIATLDTVIARRQNKAFLKMPVKKFWLAETEVAAFQAIMI